jgi:hypothetical protein
MRCISVNRAVNLVKPPLHVMSTLTSIIMKIVIDMGNRSPIAETYWPGFLAKEHMLFCLAHASKKNRHHGRFKVPLDSQARPDGAENCGYH